MHSTTQVLEQIQRHYTDHLLQENPNCRISSPPSPILNSSLKRWDRTKFILNDSHADFEAGSDREPEDNEYEAIRFVSIAVMPSNSLSLSSTTSLRSSPRSDSDLGHSEHSKSDSEEEARRERDAITNSDSDSESAHGSLDLPTSSADLLADELEQFHTTLRMGLVEFANDKQSWLEDLQSDEKIFLIPKLIALLADIKSQDSNVDATNFCVEALRALVTNMLENFAGSSVPTLEMMANLLKILAPLQQSGLLKQYNLMTADQFSLLLQTCTTTITMLRRPPLTLVQPWVGLANLFPWFAPDQLKQVLLNLVLKQDRHFDLQIAQYPEDARLLAMNLLAWCSQPDLKKIMPVDCSYALTAIMNSLKQTLQPNAEISTLVINYLVMSLNPRMVKLPQWQGLLDLIITTQAIAAEDRQPLFVDVMAQLERALSRALGADYNLLSFKSLKNGVKALLSVIPQGTTMTAMDKEALEGYEDQLALIKLYYRLGRYYLEHGDLANAADAHLIADSAVNQLPVRTHHLREVLELGVALTKALRVDENNLANFSNSTHVEMYTDAQGRERIIWRN